MDNPQSTAPPRLWTTLRWTSTIIAIGIVILALLIGQGVWNGERGLVTGHGHFGNLVFALAAIQCLIAVLLYQKKRISATHMVITFVMVVLLLTQIGIGYSGRQNNSLIAWHVPNGVLLMGLATINAALAWLRPGPSGQQAG